MKDCPLFLVFFEIPIINETEEGPNKSSFEELVFCLEAIEGPGGSLSVQNYDTSTSIDWDITVG
ncbi:MAG: hypothetical protein AABX77_01335 [Nanoarchaeota archaeon]